MVDFREDGKRMRENEEIKLFGECLVGRRRGKKKKVRPGCFLCRMGRKLMRGV